MYGCVYVTRYDVYLFRVPGVASHTKIYIYKIKTIYFISTALYCFYVPFLIFGNGVRQNIITIYYGIFHIHMLFPYYTLYHTHSSTSSDACAYNCSISIVELPIPEFVIHRTITTERIIQFVTRQYIKSISKDSRYHY